MDATEEHRKHWGGGIMGQKTQSAMRKTRERAEREIKI